MGSCNGGHKAYNQMVDVIYSGVNGSGIDYDIKISELEAEGKPLPTYEKVQEKEVLLVNMPKGADCSQPKGKTFNGQLKPRPICMLRLCCGVAIKDRAAASTAIESCQLETDTTYAYRSNPRSSKVELWNFTCIQSARQLLLSSAATAIAITFYLA